MVLNNVTKFHKILIKYIRVRERTSFKTVNFHKQRAITTESMVRYGPLSVTLILTELFQHNLINGSYLTACYRYQVMMTLHFLNDVANDAESTQTSEITP